MVKIDMTMFLYAKTEKEAIQQSENILLLLKTYIIKRKMIAIEPYWKMNNMYKLDISLELDIHILEKNILEEFLQNISSKWQSYGEPINEILISKNDNDTIVYNEKIEMINIFIHNEFEMK